MIPGRSLLNRTVVSYKRENKRIRGCVRLLFSSGTNYVSPVLLLVQINLHIHLKLVDAGKNGRLDEETGHVPSRLCFHR